MRILSYNIHKGVGWGASQKSGLKLMRQQIRDLHPDLIFFQEICGSQFEYLAEEIWPHFSYGKNAVYAKGHHGNAILSKFPIVYSHNLNISMGPYEQRGLLHTIVHPYDNIAALHLLCVHFGLLKKDRARQLSILTDYIEKNVPAHSPLIIGGDFNDWRSQATRPLVKKLGLEEAFLHHHGHYAKTFPAWIPMLKLDRIYTRGFETREAERLTQPAWKNLSDHIGLNVSLALR